MNKSRPIEPASQGELRVPATSIDYVDARTVLRLLLRRRREILTTATLCTALTAAIAVFIPPQYTAQAVLSFEPRLSPAVDTEAKVNQQAYDEATILSELETLKSRQLARRVLDKLEVGQPSQVEDKRPASGPWNSMIDLVPEWLPWRHGTLLGEEDRREQGEARAVDSFLKRLDVKLVGRSRVVKVSFTASDPVLAMQAANGVADLYLESRFEDRLEYARRTSEWLASYARRLRGDVAQAERGIENYRDQNNLVQGERGSLLTEQISDLNRRNSEAAAERGAAEANLAQAIRLRSSATAASLGHVLQSTLIQRLSEEQIALERRAAEMSEQLGPHHPLMLQLRAQQRSLDDKIKVEVNKIIHNLENQLQIARSRERALHDDLQDLKTQVAKANAAAIGFRALERDAEGSRLLLEKFTSAFLSTAAQNDPRALVPDAWIISRASIPDGPSFPRLGLLTALGLTGGLLLGVMLALILEAVGSGYHSAEEVEQDTGLPVLAHVPKVSSTSEKKGDPSSFVWKCPETIFAEAIRALYIRLSIWPLGQPPKSIAFVSSLPEEGKTTIALSLARLLAIAGQRVLFIDADLRQSRVAEMLNLDSRPGLSDFLVGAASFDEVVQRDRETNAEIILAGRSFRFASEMLITPSNFAAALEKLERQYDRIIIDSPPLTAVSDGEVVVSATSATVFVVAWDSTSREVVRYAADQIKYSAKCVIGVALNKVDLDRSRRYGYGDSAKYTGRSRAYHAG